MAYKFNYKGLEVSTDSAEDCIAVIDHLNRTERKPRRAKSKSVTNCGVAINYIGQDTRSNPLILGETFIARGFFPTTADFS
jgi:hypothetical protein